MATRKAPKPRKQPLQARSRATVDTIVAAAARILVAKGYEGFTTNAVAEKAGVSVGSLYQYFPNKESLLAELMRRHVEELERGIAAIAERAGDAPLAEVVQALIEDNVRAHLVDPELHRVLSEEVPHLGRLDWRDGFEKRSAERVRALIEARRHEIAVGNIELAVYLVISSVEAAVHDAATRRPRDLRSGALAAEVTRMIVSYLTAGVRERRRPAAA